MDPGAQIPLMGEQNVIGGYDFEFLDELSLGQRCSICLVAMRNPVQTTCGHRFCEECLLGTFRHSNAHICPQDRNPIPQDGGLFRDVAWERDILSLRVKCKRNERGCDWTGQLRHYQEHAVTCLYEDVPCANCNEDVQRRLLLAHETSECRNRIVRCEYCEEQFEFWRTEVHEGEECTRFPVDCPQQCEVREIPREELESHIKDDCLMTVVACPYKDAGCNFSDKRVNLQAHTKGSIEDHLHKTWTQLVAAKEELQKINETEGRMIEIQTQIEQFQTARRQTEISLERRHVENSELRLLVTELEIENGHLKGAVAELTERLTEEIKSLTDGLQSEKKDREDSFTRNNNANVVLKQEVAGMKDNVVSENRELRELMKKMQIRLEVLEQKERNRKSVDNAKDSSFNLIEFPIEANKSSNSQVCEATSGNFGKLIEPSLGTSKTPEEELITSVESLRRKREDRRGKLIFKRRLEASKMPKGADQEVGGSQGETRKDSLPDGGKRSIEVIQKGEPNCGRPRSVLSSVLSKWED